MALSLLSCAIQSAEDPKGSELSEKEPNLCTVSFHFKGSVIETREVASGSKLTPPDDSLIKEGYEIDG